MSTVLLILDESGADGTTSFDDQSASNHTLTPNGQVQWDDAQAPSGQTTSALFDGTADYLQIASHADFGFGTADFTFEMFFRFASNVSSQMLLDFRDTAGPALFFDGGVSLNFYVGGNQIAGSLPSANAWHHVAASRASGSTKLFLNGTQTGSTYSDSNDYGAANALRIGESIGGSTSFNGWAASIRVNKGTALYTANFTPPSLPLSGSDTPQLLAPIQDISAGPWLPSSGSPAELWQMVDGEESPDFDYDYTTSAGTMEVKFAPGSTPSVQTGHTLRYRLRGNGTCDAVVKLKQGTTVLAQWTETNVPATDTDYEHTLDSSPSFTISDYTDLRISVEAVP
jgi:hypothetical protein